VTGGNIKALTRFILRERFIAGLVGLKDKVSGEEAHYRKEDRVGRY